MKKVLKILTLIMLIITILKIGDTYSKYYTSAHTSTLEKDIGEWVIKVNETDIYSEEGQVVNVSIDKFNNFTNSNTDPTKISPGNKGYTDIVIDPSGTDVAVRYDIEINEPTVFQEINMLKMKVTFEIQTPTENMQFVQIDENKYSGIISLTDVQANEKATIRCYIEWENDENLNNLVSEIGLDKNRQEVEIPINIICTQYLGEALE